MPRIHTIDASTTITDRMTDLASGADGQDLAGHTITTVYEVPDGDRGELLLRLDNGKVYLLSADPIVHAEDGTRLSPEKCGERWEAYIMDATETEAGQAMQHLDPGFWRA